MTFWKIVCSVPVQTPKNVTFPETFDADVVPLVPPLPPPPPQPAATAASARTTPARAARYTLRFLLRISLTLTLLSEKYLRCKFPGSSLRRRSGASGCLQRPRPAFHRRRTPGRRSGRRAALPPPCSRV